MRPYKMDILKPSSVPRHMDDFEVSLEPAVDHRALGERWRDLEKRADGSFFLSWAWIGCWLDQTPESAAPMALIARHHGQIVAMGVLVAARQTRHRIIRVRDLFLHETGDPRYDGLTIEYNGFLTDRRWGLEAARRCAAWLAESDPAWDELVLSGVDPAYGAFAAPLGLKVHLRGKKSCPYVDLAAIRNSGGKYLDTRSSNTRYQIRRALRKYEESGPMSFEPAETVDQALTFFDELGVLHQAYWTGRGKPGAFSNPVFVRFHRALIGQRFGQGNIQLARVMAGQRPIGFLYNLVKDGTVHNYQSGLVYDDDGRLKPGLVSHYLAIEHNLARGAATYDFMAGESQYKRSLMSSKGELLWIALQRNRLSLRGEDALRAARDAAAKWLGRLSGGAGGRDGGGTDRNAASEND